MCVPHFLRHSVVKALLRHPARKRIRDIMQLLGPTRGVLTQRQRLKTGICISKRTNVKMRLNDDLMQLTTDAGKAWWTVTDALQNLHIINNNNNHHHHYLRLNIDHYS